jgi:leucyl aminopeptidase
VTAISLRKGTATKTRADAVVIAVAKGAGGPVLAEGGQEVAREFGRRFPSMLSALGVTGAAGQVVRLPADGVLKAPVLALVGIGPVERVDAEALRRAAGAAVRQLAGLGTVALALPAATADNVRALAEGAALGGYSFDRYRSEHQPAPVDEVVVLTDLAKDKAALAGAASASVVARAVHLARDWVNTPPGDLVPADFAGAVQAAVKAAAQSAKVAVEVLDEAALEAGRYGGILGVGQGSAHPPRLVKLSYRPAAAVGELAFVGKGITFDSGGLSLKPATGMVTMKCDMAGAAAVAAAVIAIAQLDLPVSVTGWLCVAENMPSGSATRPGDVLTAYGGKTIEVLNTDAEGRLVLADGLVKASADFPDLIVDVATLTGACVVALGSRVSGVLANDDELLELIPAVAGEVGEAIWPLPIPEEMREKVRASKIADLGNHNPDKYGGALYAAAFLREFVGEGLRWAHLDIAGPAFNEGEAFGYTPKGGTGAAVRTLVALARASADRRI